jgi:CheY-like chemotaxis protein
MARKCQDAMVAEGAQAPERGQRSERVISAGRSSLRVLVADDNQIATDLLSRLVKLWGHDVRTAHDGAGALEMAFAYLPDVLVLDVAMPNGDGCEVARQVRDSARLRNTLLIALTGHADEQHRQLSREAGFDLYLLKPLKPSILETLLLLERDRLLGRWAGELRICDLPRPIDPGQDFLGPGDHADRTDHDRGKCLHPSRRRPCSR